MTRWTPTFTAGVGVPTGDPVLRLRRLPTAIAPFGVVFLRPAVRRRRWPLLLAYPLAMTFTLVHSGDHHVVDTPAGWAYLAATFLIVAAAGWRRMRAVAAGSGTGA